MAVQLSANQDFVWASDMSRVNLLSNGTSLDCSETPFFYGMKDGDLLEASTDSSSVWGRSLIGSQKRGLDINWVGIATGICGTVSSNHTLSSLGYETALRRGFFHGSLIRELLEINKRGDKNQAARVKVFRSHIQHNLSLEDFCEMDTGLMPRVFAWIGCALGETDEERTYLTTIPPPIVRLEALVRILRAMPMLCGF